MSTCIACGQALPDASPPTWTFIIQRRVPSQNEHLHNVGTARWAYKKSREGWRLCFVDVMNTRHVSRATGKRRVKFTRLYSGLERERDYDNLVGGFKVVLDAMVLARMLVGDDSKSLDSEYTQDKGKVTGVRVEIWDSVECTESLEARGKGTECPP